MSLFYLLKEAFRTINRNREQFWLSSSILSICLLLLSLFSLLTFNVIIIIHTASNRAEIYAFISDDAIENLTILEQRISSIAGVDKINFVSKEEAIEDLRRDLGADTTLLSAIGENPLPASIRIRLKRSDATVENVTAIEQKLLLLPGVTEVWSGKELLAQLNRALNTVFLLNIIIFAIVTISILFIVFQTVENSVNSRAHEIEIMELVGATRAAIHVPFLIQGILQGVVGGISSFGLTFILYRIVSSFIPAPLFPTWLLLLGNISIGLILGLGGSYIALSRLPSTNASAPYISKSRWGKTTQIG
ncbi:MAG: cell division protein FtsX [bacterium]